LQEAGDFWLFEEFFFEGDGRGNGADAFADTGGSTVHGCEKMFEGVDGPPESATGFFRGVVRSAVRGVQINTER
jgi:hypothetical protein